MYDLEIYDYKDLINLKTLLSEKTEFEKKKNNIELINAIKHFGENIDFNHLYDLVDKELIKRKSISLDYNSLEQNLLEQIITECGYTHFHFKMIVSHIFAYLYYGTQIVYFPSIVIPFSNYYNYSNTQVLVLVLILMIGIILGNLSISLQYQLISSNRILLIKIHLICSLLLLFSLTPLLGYYWIGIVMRLLIGFNIGFIFPVQNNILIESLPTKKKSFVFTFLIIILPLSQLLVFVLILIVVPKNSPLGIQKYLWCNNFYLLFLAITYIFLLCDSHKNILVNLNEKKGFQMLKNDIIKEKNILLSSKLKKTILFELKFPFVAYDLKTKKLISEVDNSNENILNYENMQNDKDNSQEINNELDYLNNVEKLELKLHKSDSHMFNDKYIINTLCLISLIFGTLFINSGIGSYQSIFAQDASLEHVPYNPTFQIYYQIALNIGCLISPPIAASLIEFTNITFKWIIFGLTIIDVILFIIALTIKSTLIACTGIANAINVMILSLVFTIITKTYEIKIADKSVGLIFLFGNFSAVFLLFLILFSNTNTIFIVSICLSGLNSIVSLLLPKLNKLS